MFSKVNIVSVQTQYVLHSKTNPWRKEKKKKETVWWNITNKVTSVSYVKAQKQHFNLFIRVGLLV